MNWILQASTTAVQHMLPLKGTVFERASPPRLQGWQPYSECAAPAKCAGLDDCLKGSPVGTLAHCPTVICPEARGMLARRIPSLHIAPHPASGVQTARRWMLPADLRVGRHKATTQLAATLLHRHPHPLVGTREIGLANANSVKPQRSPRVSHSLQLTEQLSREQTQPCKVT